MPCARASAFESKSVVLLLEARSTGCDMLYALMKLTAAQLDTFIDVISVIHE